MLKQTGKSKAVLFLLILLTPLLLWFYLKTEQFRISIAMEKQLEKQELDTLVLEKNALVWYKMNKEILLGDQLFDVKKIELKNNQWHITGLFDKEESKIKARLARLLEEQQRDDHQSQQLIFRIIHTELSGPVAPDLLLRLNAAALKQQYPALNVQLPTRPTVVFTPPPDCIAA